MSAVTTNDYLAVRTKGAEYAPDSNTETQFIDFVDSNGNYKPASIAAGAGPAPYTLVLPGINPVDAPTDKHFVDSLREDVNDQVLVVAPRTKVVSGHLVPASPAVLDGKFIGLSSGFVSDFIPTPGVPVPYQHSEVDGIFQANQINTSYFWQRVGDVVSVTGTIVLAGQANHDSLVKCIDIKLPVPLKEDDYFGGTCTYISTSAQVGSFGRDPRFTGIVDMVCGQNNYADSTHTEFNNFKMAVFPKEWTRDIMRIEWKASGSGQDVKGMQLRFHVMYSVTPITKDGTPTPAYVVDRVLTAQNPGNWNAY